MKLSFQLSLIFSAMTLVACQPTTNPSNSNTATTNSTASATGTNNTDSTVATTKADTFVSKLPANAPTYKVATSDTNPPFSFMDDHGKLMGLDIDAIHAIGEAGGFKVQFYSMPWADMFRNVETGKFDLAASGISYSDSRNTTYNLSHPYFFNPAAMMWKSDHADIKNLNDAKNIKLGTIKGSIMAGQFKAIGGKDLTEFNTPFLMFRGLMTDKVDAIAYDEPVFRYNAKQYPEMKVKIVAYEGRDVPTSQQIILLKKGNDEVTQKVNAGIDKILSNGEMQKIEEKWLGKK
ncbi:MULTISPECIES: substrate-binding periplasmic protein [unclassified Acinetobacter]|uniref:substrate-binding periplasmic protein n=1 Tax=unclassified Acinetobacter TaxID=196816 RepID=UPI0035B8B1E1